VLWKTTVGLLRVDELAVEGYLEDAISAFDQRRLNVEFFCYFFRQTGGTGFVVSNHAVLDLQLGHVEDLRWVMMRCFDLGKVERRIWTPPPDSR